MPLCKLGTVKRQAGGTNTPTVHGKWVTELGRTMERCRVWRPSPGVLTEHGAQHILFFVNGTCGYKFKAGLGADEENQQQNQGVRAQGHSGVGEGKAGNAPNP